MDRQLVHHGIVGMKWGVRRTPAQLGHKSKVTKSKKNDANPDYKNARKKSIQQMSDQELRIALNRLNMEEQYARMNPSQIARGRKALVSALGTVGAVSAEVGAIVKLHTQYNVIRGWFERKGG